MIKLQQGWEKYIENTRQCNDKKYSEELKSDK